MFRALLLGQFVGLAVAGPALAAGDIDTCRDAGGQSDGAARGLRERDRRRARSPADSKAAAFAYRGDTLMREARL